MKTINFLAWAAAVVAAALMVCGTVAYIFDVRPFGADKPVNFFNVANSFLLVVICCLIYRRLNQAEVKK
jgi:hypothetical protein